MMKMKDHLNKKTFNRLDTMRKIPMEEETEEEKAYRKERELRELMGEFDSTWERKNGAVRRKR